MKFQATLKTKMISWFFITLLLKIMTLYWEWPLLRYVLILSLLWWLSLFIAYIYVEYKNHKK
ncbi:hypothetical protein IV53_GL000995 [Ligilactobacillus ceti DSM 22408]|uniref:Uncharacterized protein n=1 Tax=Ligilactobacillus ceti DSM 22408 TaxID=1122146 RepID=A0A0R2KI64_9LACO|nr:hypothetical protein IV53_GL000995 [Ligilactobacillus ceti DSM 22408]